MLRVKSVISSPSQFYVEGDSLVCAGQGCGRVVRRLPAEHVWFNKRQKLFLTSIGVLKLVEKTQQIWQDVAPHVDGERCVKCGRPMEIRWHLVDITDEHGNGYCACEYFQFSLLPYVTKLTALSGDYRCRHIEAARDFALEMTIRAHNKREKVF